MKTNFTFLRLSFLMSLFLLIGSYSYACQYQLKMYDSWGDGWNGGKVTVKVNGTAVLTDQTVSSGHGPIYVSFTVSTGDLITTDYTVGSYGSENEYWIFDATGATVGHQGANNTTPGDITTAIVASCPVTLDASITAIGYGGIYGQDSVFATLKNMGLNTLVSATINWKKNGVLQTPISWTGSLVTNASEQVVLTKNSGTNTYVVYSSSPNGSTDQNLSNDTATATITPFFPYTEPFDVAGNWTVTSSSNYKWTYSTDHDGNGTPSSSTGPAHDHGNVSPWGFMFTEASYSGGPTTLVSPVFDFSTKIGVNFKFWYHMYGSAMGSLHLDAFYDGIWHDDVMPAISGQQQSSATAAWLQSNVSVSSVNLKSNVQFRLRGVSAGTYAGDISVDDIMISANDPLPLDIGITGSSEPSGVFCSGNQPIDAILTNLGSTTLTTATVNWSVNGIVQTPISWTGSLVLGASDTIVLNSAFNFANGVSYDINAWTSAPNNGTDGNTANDTNYRYGISASMSGTYTINSNVPNVGQNFNSFADAITALNNKGVCGAVTFNVASGTYNEQLEISEIAGASSTNTITFQSASGDSTDVVLQYSSASSTSPYTVYLNGADWITFNQMTIKALGSSYAWVFYMKNGSNNNTLTHNIIEGLNTNSTSGNYILIINNNTIDTNNVIDNNILRYGSYGIYLMGASSNNIEGGNVITNNTIKDQYYTGIYAYYQDRITINNNNISTSKGNSSYQGINFNYSRNHSEIIGNSITVENTGCSGGIKVYRYNYYTPYSDSLTVANNTISINATTGSNIAIYHYYSRNVNYYYNTVNIVGSDAGNYAMYLYGSYPVTVKNNILRNNANGYAIYSGTTSSYLTNDYNNLLSNGTYLGYIGGNRTDLAAWQTGSGEATHSVSIEPGFNSVSDLHALSIPMNDKGIPVYGVTTDKDGNTRSTTATDVGAYEYTPPLNDLAIIDVISPAGATVPLGTKIPITIKVVNYGFNNQSNIPFIWSQDEGVTIHYDTATVTINSLDTTTITLNDSMYFSAFGSYGIGIIVDLSNDEQRNNDSTFMEILACSTLSGTYTIGGSGADLKDFSQAAQALNSCGVSGPVTFNVAAGTYNEQFEINAVTGASSTNTITFQSASGDKNDVNIEYFNSGLSNNYIVWLNGADNIIFKDMSFSTANAGTYAHIFYFDNHADTNKVVGCNLKGKYGTSVNYAAIYAFGDLNNANVIENNNIKDCYAAVYWGGQSSSASYLAHNNVFKNNDISNYYYYGLYLYYHDAVQIIGNKISGSATYGVYLRYCDNDVLISKNDIQNTGSYGLYMYYCDGTASNRFEISNNFISEAASYGIYDRYPKYRDYYNNSINVSGSYGLYFYNSSSTYSGHAIYNNNFVNTGSGYAAYVYSGTYLDSMDYNNYYSPSGSFVYLSGSKADLTAVKAYNSNMNQNSVSMDPNYSSNVDLHVSSASFDNLGSPFIPITDDIDGETRSLTTPDIGADEYTFYPNDVKMVDVWGPYDRYCGSTNDSIWVRIQNVGNITQDTVPVIASVTTPSGTITLTDTAFSLGAQAFYDFYIGSINTTSTGNYSIEAYTNLAVDGNAANDTMVKAFKTLSFVANFPYSEDFTNWPPAYWNVNGGTVPWDQYAGNSARADFWNYDAPNVFIMSAPPVDLSNVTNPLLQFSYSYGSSSYNDSLEIQMKTCGTSWATIWKKGGNDLASNDGAGNTTPGSYIDETINIPSAYYGQNLMIRFKGISDFGPDLFIDKILVAEPPVVALGNDTTVCANTSLQLDAGSGANYAYYWRTLGNASPIGTSQYYTAATPDTFIVTVTDNNTGLKANDTLILQHFAVPTVVFTGSDTICYTDSTQVNIAFTGATPWNYTYTAIGGTPTNVTGVTSPWTPYLSPSATTSYIITSVTDSNGCTLNQNSDTVIITVNPLPTVTLSTLSDICANAATFTLTGGSPATGTYSGTGVDVSGNFSATTAGVGTHSITYSYTDGNGCTDSASTNQIVNPQPSVTITAGANPVTYGFSTTLNGSATNGIGTYVYAWDPAASINGATNTQNVNTIGLMANTLYTLTVTDQTATTSCQDTAQLLVHISGGPLSVAPYTNHDTVCQFDTVVLSANSSGGGTNHSYTWTSNPSGFTSSLENPTVVPSSAAWYIVSVFDGANTTTDSVYVGSWVLPTASYSAFDTICFGDSAMITASFTGEKPFSYTYNGIITNNVNAMSDSYYKAPTSNTTYKITEVIDNNGCKISGDIDSTIITVNTLPTVVYTGSDTLCFGDSALALATFTGAMPFTYTYDGNTVSGVNAATDGIYLTPTASKQYKITNVTDNNGCSISGNLDSIYLEVNALPTYSSSPFDTICYGETTNLTISLTGASPWNFTVDISGNTFGDFSPIATFLRTDDPLVTSVYKIIALTDANGCSMDASLNTDSIEVFVNPLPTPSFTGLSSAYCEDAAIATLLGTPTGGTFSGTAVTGASFSPSTAGPGSYDIVYTYTDGNGCTNADTNSTIVNALPIVQLSGLNTDYCVDAQAATLLGTPTGGTFSGAGVTASTFTPATATVGTHTVYYTYTDGNSCTNVDSTSVIVNALPVITLASLTDVCISEPTFAISGASPSGGTWTGNGVTNNFFNANTAGAATHMLTYTYTDANGCVNSDSTTQVVNALPILSISGFASAYCVNGSADTLSGLPTGGNFGGLGINGNIFDPAQTAVGTISILYYYTDANGCFNSVSAMTTINPYHTPSFSGLASTYCLNDTIAVLTPDSTGGVFTGTGILGSSFDPLTAGVGSHNVTYTYTNAFGCVDDISYSTNVIGLPTVSVSGLVSTYCADANPDTLYGVPTGGTFMGISGNVFDPSLATTNSNNEVIYSYTDSLGCSNTDTISTYVWALPTIALPADQELCEDATALVDAGANANYSYLWSTGDLTHSISVDTSLYGLGAHNYSVMVTDTITGCTANDSTQVTFEAYPVIPIADTFNVCGYSPVYAVAGTDPNYAYIWSTGATTASIIIDSSMTNGNYMKFSVTVSSPAGCTESKEFWVKFRPDAYVDLGRDTFMCITGTMKLDAGSGYNYLWSTGATTQFINVIGDTVGVGLFTYDVTVERFGCTATDDINIMVNPCLGIETYDGDLALDIYPNPTKGRFTLDVMSRDAASFSYSIFNMAGKVLFQGNIDSDGKTIYSRDFDMSTLPKGVYFIRLQNNNIVKVEKIIIQ